MIVSFWISTPSLASTACRNPTYQSWNDGAYELYKESSHSGMVTPSNAACRMWRLCAGRHGARGHLVQAIAPAAPRHGAASELVHDDDLLAAHDVVHILRLQLLSLERIDQVGRPLLPRIVQVWHLPSKL